MLHGDLIETTRAVFNGGCEWYSRTHGLIRGTPRIGIQEQPEQGKEYYISYLSNGLILGIVPV